MNKTIILVIIICFSSIMTSFGQEKLVIRKRINDRAQYINFGKKITAEMMNEKLYKGRLTGVNNGYLTIETRKDGQINLFVDSINSLYVFRYGRLALYIGEIIAEATLPVIILIKIFKQDPDTDEFWMLYYALYLTTDYFSDYTTLPIKEFNRKHYRIDAP